MNYIKTYENSEKKYDYEEHSKINDALITIVSELKDDGFSFYINELDCEKSYIIFSLSKESKFQYNEISDRLQMFFDYIKTLWYDIEISYYYILYHNSFSDGGFLQDRGHLEPYEDTIMNNLYNNFKKEKDCKR